MPSAYRRFLSPAPLGPAGGVNLYAYAAGDPLSYIDPLGLCPESTTYSRVFTAGIRGAIVFGGGIELGFAVDSDGRLGLVGKASAGFGMEVAAKNPITDTIASALSEPFLKSAGPSAGKASGTIYDLMGFEPESHASFFVGVTSDLKTSPITGVEFGNIGGGVYETGTLVLPIWDPVFVRKTFDWIKERAKAVADWF